MTEKINILIEALREAIAHEMGEIELNEKDLSLIEEDDNADTG